MKVAFTDFVQSNLDLETDLLDQAGLEMCVAEPQCKTEQDVIELISTTGATAIISNYAPIGKAAFAALDHLRIISVPLVGVDSIDTTEAKKAGVWVAHVPDAWVAEVGAHTMAMVLSLIRHLPFYDRSVRAGRWDYEEHGALHRPSDLTFGLLGCGRIGQQAARIGATCFSKVIACDPYISLDSWPEWIDRVKTPEQLFEQSTIVSLHLPLTPETYHIVNGSLLNRMATGSYIVNASRGALIDSAALVEALDSGQIGGAGLDVFEQEPPDSDAPLRHHPRTLVSPHSAYYSIEADMEGRSRAVKNVIDFHKNGRPSHVVVEGSR